MPKKILILGANGMLGQDLQRVFPRTMAWDKEELDITKKSEIVEKFKSLKLKGLKPTVVINAAAYNAVDECETAKGWVLARKINGLAPEYLAKICAQIKAIFVHYSTDYVFRGDKKQGYKEDDLPDPISKYGQSKLLGEKLALKNNLRTYIIRTCKLFGRAGGGKKSFPQIILELARKQKEIKVVHEEKGRPTYTPDLARQTKLLLEGKYPFGIYHITNEGSACTWYEWAKEVFKIAKSFKVSEFKSLKISKLKSFRVKLVPVSSKEFKRKAKRPKFSVLLNTKLPPLRSWQEALKEFLKNNRNFLI